MFLKDFLSYFIGAPDNFNVDVNHVEKIGRTFYFATPADNLKFTSEIDSLKEDIENNQKEIKDLEADIYEERFLKNKLEKELDELRATFLAYQLSPDETIGNLIGRNDELTQRVAQLQESLNKFHRRHEDDQKEIKDLRARKNKATVKRCLTTGKLVANFDGVEYQMVKKN